MNGRLSDRGSHFWSQSHRLFRMLMVIGSHVSCTFGEPVGSRCPFHAIIAGILVLDVFSRVPLHDGRYCHVALMGAPFPAVTLGRSTILRRRHHWCRGYSHVERAASAPSAQAVVLRAAVGRRKILGSW